jgi:hypothetical protein
VKQLPGTSCDDLADGWAIVTPDPPGPSSIDAAVGSGEGSGGMGIDDRSVVDAE